MLFLSSCDNKFGQRMVEQERTALQSHETPEEVNTDTPEIIENKRRNK